MAAGQTFSVGDPSGSNHRPRRQRPECPRRRHQALQSVGGQAPDVRLDADATGVKPERVEHGSAVHSALQALGDYAIRGGGACRRPV